MTVDDDNDNDCFQSMSKLRSFMLYKLTLSSLLLFNSPTFTQYTHYLYDKKIYDKNIKKD